MAYKFNPFTGTLDLSESGGGGPAGANTTLSNLVSPTAVNQDILPDSPQAHSVGTQASPFSASSIQTINNAFINIKNSTTSGSIRAVIDGQAGTTPSGATRYFSIRGNTDGTSPLSMFSKNSTTATQSRPLNFETGNNSSTGDSGSINLTAGTVNTGTRGTVNIQGQQISDVNNSLHPEWWGGDIPSFILDATTTEAQNIGGAIISGKGNSSQGLIGMFTQDIQGGTDSSMEMDLVTGYVTGTGNSGSIFLETGSQSGASGNSGNIVLFAGDSTNGNSGLVRLETGTAGSTRGDIQLKGNRVDASTSVGPLRLPQLSADPGAPLNGDMWYNTTSNQIKAHVNSVTVVIA